MGKGGGPFCSSSTVCPAEIEPGWDEGGWKAGENAVSQPVGAPGGRGSRRPCAFTLPISRLAPGHLCTVQDGRLCCRRSRGREGSVTRVGLEGLSRLRWPASFPGILARQHLLVTLVASGWGQGLEASLPSSAWRPAPKNTPSFLGPFSSSLPQTGSCWSHLQFSEASLQRTRIPGLAIVCVF